MEATPDGVAPVLTFDHVTVAGDAGPRLVDACASVPACGVTVIAGPSGSGKSTLLRCANRLEVPVSGRVLFRGDDVAELDPLTLRRRVGMVFQRPTPFPGPVRENLAVARPGITDPEATAMLARVGLAADFVDREATELSGGEAQRVCLARTLVTGPEVVLMDEVTASVDPVQRLGLEGLAGDLAAAGVVVVWVTHDLEQLRRIADHVIVVIEGRVAHQSDVAGLVTAPGAVRTFLGGGGLDE